MAGINPQQVYLPSPDQSLTTGAVAVAPTGTAAVTDARTELGEEWVSGGYVDENGVSLAVDKSFTEIRDWAQSIVRNALESYTGTLNLNFLQIDQFSAERVLGPDNVTVADATTEHGNMLTLAIGNDVPPVESWCFSMKDEDRRVRIYVPRGQITELGGDVPFVPGEANVWGGTIATYDDGTGHSIYVIYDDGTVIADNTANQTSTNSTRAKSGDSDK